jgi:hypothetical protein
MRGELFDACNLEIYLCLHIWGITNHIPSSSLCMLCSCARDCFHVHVQETVSIFMCKERLFSCSCARRDRFHLSVCQSTYQHYDILGLRRFCRHHWLQYIILHTVQYSRLLLFIHILYIRYLFLGLLICFDGKINKYSNAD